MFKKLLVSRMLLLVGLINLLILLEMLKETARKEDDEMKRVVDVCISCFHSSLFLI